MLNTIITSAPMYVCGTLAVLLGFSISYRWDRPRFLLLIFMLAATLLYMGQLTFFNHIDSAIPITDTLYCFCNPAIFPLFLIYIEELVLKNPSRRRQLLYLLPATLCGISAGALYVLMDKTEISTFIYHHIYGSGLIGPKGYVRALALVHLTVKIVFALEILPVCFASWRYINTYNRKIENYYSNTEDKTLHPIKPLLSLFVIASMISFAYSFIGRNYFAESIWLVTIPAATFSTLILLIGYFGLYQQFSVSNLEEDDKFASNRLQQVTELITQTQDIQVSPADMDYLANEIRRLMEQEKIFLHSNLKLNDLAMMLNTNRNYIYNAINKEIGLSFSDYVNMKRIQYASDLIDRNPKVILADVAQKSGFSSASSFYRNFKSIMGCTPSEYQKKQGRASLPAPCQNKNL